MRQINTKKFPRVATFVVVAGALGVIARLGREEEKLVAVPGSSDFIKQTIRYESEPFAEVHIVHEDDEPTEQHGFASHQDTVSHTETKWVKKNVPFADLRQATYAEILPHLISRQSDWTAFQAAQAGYGLTAEEAAALPANEKQVLGIPLTAAEQKVADAFHATLAAEKALRDKIANDPRAIAAEEEIEKERMAFIASVEARRQALHDIIAAE